ncbi:MAG TPA: DUF5671 domain-containing protein [Ktedonobacterales bacterium]|nr:DUF5671 domain-containing protein [Ktedonobacterales bacterium]
MARSLYRLYLYIVAIVMLGFAGFGLGGLLHTLLLKTPLRGQYETAPAGAELVQTSVLAITALVVALALGGLHYWLIRRDIATDPTAAGGAVRALLLNLAQAVAAIFALFTGSSALYDLTLSPNSYNRGTLALPFTFWLVSTLIVVALQLERGRGQAAEGAPRNIERLHLYFLQLLALLAGVIGTWAATLSDSITGLFYAAGAIPNPCSDQQSRFYLPPYYGPPGINEPRPVCDFPQALGGEWLAALWVALVIVAYIWLARRDPPYVLRVLAHALGFLTGAIVAIVGIGEGASFALRVAFGVEEASAVTLATRLAFVATLLLGGLALWWYRRQLEVGAAASPLGRQGTDLTIQAISTVALGVPFYLGVTFLLRDLVERVVPSGNVPAPDQVASDLAILIAGVAYPVVALLLRRNTTATAPIGPRRTVVLAGLAAGALVGAIGLAVGLYQVISAALGSPLGDSWQVSARLAFIVVLVGAFLTGLNLYRLLTDRRPEPPAAPKPAPAPAAPAGSIERVLDDLVAGRITREQAAAALRALGAR